jgi:hypothetical protein
VASDGVCKDVRFIIDTEEFIMYFYVIPLAGFDMVLGVHWLRTLGPILWDFANDRMSCWQDDHPVIWQGLPACRSVTTAHAMEADHLMPMLLEQFDDVQAAVIANIHVQATGIQNIRSLIFVTLDLSSVQHARWCDNILLTLGRYSLSDHVLLDTTSVSVPAWDRMDIVIKLWIWGTISPDLQDVVQQRGHPSTTSTSATVKLALSTSTPPSGASFRVTSASMTTVGR